MFWFGIYEIFLLILKMLIYCECYVIIRSYLFFLLFVLKVKRVC